MDHNAIGVRTFVPKVGYFQDDNYVKGRKEDFMHTVQDVSARRVERVQPSYVSVV